MKSKSVRLSEKELEHLKKIKKLGFASIAEVIKCATLSLVESLQNKEAA